MSNFHDKNDSSRIHEPTFSLSSFSSFSSPQSTIDAKYAKRPPPPSEVAVSPEDPSRAQQHSILTLGGQLREDDLLNPTTKEKLVHGRSFIHRNGPVLERRHEVGPGSEPSVLEKSAEDAVGIFGCNRVHVSDHVNAASCKRKCHHLERSNSISFSGGDHAVNRTCSTNLSASAKPIMSTRTTSDQVQLMNNVTLDSARGNIVFTNTEKTSLLNTPTSKTRVANSPSSSFGVVPPSFQSTSIGEHRTLISKQINQQINFKSRIVKDKLADRRVSELEPFQSYIQDFHSEEKNNGDISIDRTDSTAPFVGKSSGSSEQYIFGENKNLSHGNFTRNKYRSFLGTRRRSSHVLGMSSSGPQPLPRSEVVVLRNFEEEEERHIADGRSNDINDEHNNSSGIVQMSKSSLLGESTKVSCAEQIKSNEKSKSTWISAQGNENIDIEKFKTSNSFSFNSYKNAKITKSLQPMKKENGNKNLNSSSINSQGSLLSSPFDSDTALYTKSNKNISRYVADKSPATMPPVSSSSSTHSAQSKLILFQPNVDASTVLESSLGKNRSQSLHCKKQKINDSKTAVTFTENSGDVIRANQNKLDNASLHEIEKNETKNDFEYDAGDLSDGDESAFKFVIDFAVGMALHRHIIRPYICMEMEKEEKSADDKLHRREVDRRIIELSQLIEDLCSGEAVFIRGKTFGSYADHHERDKNVTSVADRNVMTDIKDSAYDSTIDSNRMNIMSVSETPTNKNEEMIEIEIINICKIKNVTCQDKNVLSSWYESGGDKVLPYTSKEWSDWWIERCSNTEKECEMLKLTLHSKIENDSSEEVLGYLYLERNVIDQYPIENSSSGSRVQKTFRQVRTTLIRGVRISPYINPVVFERLSLRKVKEDITPVEKPAVRYIGVAATLVTHVILKSLLYGSACVGVSSTKDQDTEEFFTSIFGSPSLIRADDGRRYYRIVAEERWEILYEVVSMQIRLKNIWNEKYHMEKTEQFEVLQRIRPTFCE